MRFSRSTAFALLATGLLGVSTISACGSDESAGDTTSPADTASTVAEVDETAPVAPTDTEASSDSAPVAPTDTEASSDSAPVDPEADVESPNDAAGDGACALFSLDEVSNAAGQPVTIGESGDPEQCDYQDESMLPAATVLLTSDDGDQLQIARITLDTLATSVDEITVAGFDGVHGHDLDAGFATYDTAVVSTGPMVLSVSLYGGDPAPRSAGVLDLLDIGVPRL